MNGLDQITEVLALDAGSNRIRIPGEQDVPVSPRIRQLIDSQPFRRLASISQLGLVSLVYPGATHCRFEHSLGVYRMALLFLKRLSTRERFREAVSKKQAETFLVAALLHDIGHWPYCHPIEDMRLNGIRSHESLARKRISESGIPDILDSQFGINAGDVCNLLEGNNADHATRLLHSVLSGPVDVDKMDYLYRDSLHAGVPYGMNYDRSRLIGSLCLDEKGSSLAISDKGCTAAELMVFARYVMFREVYWHHTVRSATAMLQRAVFVLREKLDFPALQQMTEAEFQKHLIDTSLNTDVERLVFGLFGPNRILFKRLAQFHVHESREIFQRISRRPYTWLVRCAVHLSQLIGNACQQRMLPVDILIDAPPQGLEVQFQIDVRDRNGRYRPMTEVSPVVETLATEQFDNFVKQVRIFVNPDFSDLKQSDLPFAELLNQAIDQTESQDESRSIGDEEIESTSTP